MICKRGEPVSERPGEEGLAGRLKRKATQAKRGAAQAAAHHVLQLSELRQLDPDVLVKVLEVVPHVARVDARQQLPVRPVQVRRVLVPVGFGQRNSQ